VSSLVRGAGYFSRSYGDDLKLANTRLRRTAVVGFLALLVAFPYLVSAQYVDLTNQAGIAIIGAIGLNILTGYAGQLSLGHAGLLGISGFAAGILASKQGLPFPVVAITTMACGGVIGLILGLPALRLRGLYLVLSTLAFHFLALIAINWYQSSRNQLEAFVGLRMPKLKIGPFKAESLNDWYYFLLVVVILVALISVNLLRTRPGRAWIALRERDLVAESLGISIAAYKLLAFVVSSVLAALAGVLLVYYNGNVGAETYTLDLAVAYLVMVIVGGLGSTAGAILGALFVTMSLRLLTFAFEAVGASSEAQTIYLIPLQTILFGVIMAGFLLFEPRGLIGVWERVRTYFELWPFRYRPLGERQ
jgi:branched-chain amino acid transport system permease protein